MNRFLGAMIVLGILISIVVTGFYINTKTSNSVSEKISSSIEYQNKDDFEQARKELRSALEEWEQNMEMMLLFISHGKLDEIEESINIADTYMNIGDKTMCLAECKRALILLEHFNHVEYPSIDNIF